MVVAIMAVLAVVGFGFASSMKLEFAATRAIRDLSQARMAAQAALQLFAGTLAQDASAEASSTAGPLADHAAEGLYTTGASQLLIKWGNLEVRTEQVTFRDEASKMNLNAFGNLSKWNYSDTLSDSDPLPGGDPAAQLYHGANERFSSFEISFEEFFYQQRAVLWAGVSDNVARIRAANMARAICLYRYGGKKDGDSDDEPDYAGDGKLGVAGVDDDQDHDVGDEFGLAYDETDNDGDGNVDEEYEGYDEPDEYNPIDPDGDGDTATTTGPKDDRKFNKIDEFQDAISHAYSISGTHAGGIAYSADVPAAVNYAGDPTPDQAALDAFDTEATRIFNCVKDNLTTYSYNLDIRSVCIDDPGRDGYDNDGDGKIDQADTTGAATIAGIKTQLDAGKSIYEVNINERDITKAAQAAYIYWKLSHLVTYTKADGSITEPELLVKGFSPVTAADIVDYRDTDCIPTKIPAGALGVDALGANVPLRDTYGFEGLHITEVGRYMLDATSSAVSGANWAAGSIDVAASMDLAARTGTLSISGLADGAYLLKLSVDAIQGTITFTSGSVTKDATAAGEFWFGPLNVSGGTGTITVSASATIGTYTVSGFHVFLPYIEIMNMSKRKRDMTRFSVQIGANTPLSISDADIVGPATWANGEDLDKKYIARHRKVGDGEFDTTNGHGPYYGYFLIVYDQASFDNNFGGGTPDGTWNDAGEDFPICVMPDLFAGGFEGERNVKLLDAAGTLIAGGELDGFTDTGIGECKPLSATTLAASRLICGGNMSFVYDYGDPDYKIRPETDGTNPSTSPGRWNRNDGKSNETYIYPQYFWPQTEAFFGPNACDIVIVSDAGAFTSPGEIARLSAPRLWASTLSFYSSHSVNDGSRQPLFRELLAFVVAARAPARLNLNTAGDALLQAAMVGSQQDFATLVDARPFTSIENLGRKDFITTLFVEGTDNDGDNVRDEYSEREEWYTLHSNVFTLRAHCFSATIAGEIKMPGGKPGGTVVARYALSAVCDRGRELGSDGRPASVILTIRPEGSD